MISRNQLVVCYVPKVNYKLVNCENIGKSYIYIGTEPFNLYWEEYQFQCEASS